MPRAVARFLVDPLFLNEVPVIEKTLQDHGIMFERELVLDDLGEVEYHLPVVKADGLLVVRVLFPDAIICRKIAGVWQVDQPRSETLG